MIQQKVHYLFPNVTEPMRAALRSIQHMRRAVILGLNTRREGMKAGDWQTLDQSTSETESAFMAAKAEVEAYISGQLTPVQIEILNSEFLSIPFES